MKNVKMKYHIELPLLWILGIAVGFFLGIQEYKREIPQSIIEVQKVVKQEVKVNNCACIPCEMEPPIEKCAFNSFAYQALVDKKDIYGDYELRKGDIYYSSTEPFFTEYDQFCRILTTEEEDSHRMSDCFKPDIILNKNLFKPIK